MVESNQKGLQDPEEPGLMHQQSNVTETQDEALKAELAKLQDELGEGKSVINFHSGIPILNVV